MTEEVDINHDCEYSSVRALEGRVERLQNTWYTGACCILSMIYRRVSTVNGIATDREDSGPLVISGHVTY